MRVSKALEAICAFDSETAIIGFELEDGGPSGRLVWWLRFGCTGQGAAPAPS